MVGGTSFPSVERAISTAARTCGRSHQTVCDVSIVLICRDFVMLILVLQSGKEFLIDFLTSRTFYSEKP